MGLIFNFSRKNGQNSIKFLKMTLRNVLFVTLGNGVKWHHQGGKSRVEIHNWRDR